MYAQVLQQPQAIIQRPLVGMETPVPTPGPRQLLLRVQACGVCHTDLHTVEGDLPLPRLPLIPGHQVVGVVTAMGREASGFQVGDRAGAIWLHRTCGECTYCRTGRENLCESAEFTGLHVDGGYAEYMVVDAAFAYPLPTHLAPAEIAPLLCGGVIGYRALRLAQIQPGETLGLYGFGNSAHIAIQIARYWDCRVFVFTRSAAHQAHALALGAAWAGRADAQPPARIDAGIIFAPAGELAPAALRVLNPGGVLALAGIHMTPLPAMPYELLYRERTLRSVANCTRQDAVALLALAETIPLRTDVTLLPLSEANAALLALKQSQFQGDAVLIP